MDIVLIIINSIIASAIYGWIALGFNLIYGVTKFFNLAHGAMVVISGYAFLWFSRMPDADLFYSVFASVAIAGFIGWLVDRFIYCPLRKKKASNMVFLVSSLGVLVAIQSLAAIVFTNQFRLLGLDMEILPTIQIYDYRITEIQLVIITTMLLIAFGLGIFLRHTLFGKAVRAINDDEEVAKMVGIDTERIIGQVFFVGSAIAGLAGILIGFDTGIDPAMGMGLLFKGVVASVIGGVGNVYGGVVGAFMLGFIENFGIWKLSSEWKDAIAFMVLIIIMIFRPQGIFNKDALRQ
ncbi:MAG: branched-chain amino acid ABC transporter permease [Candidatus Paceibacterota bacterium]